MAALLLIAHAPLASALRSVAAHVYAECSDKLFAVDVPPGAEPDQVEAQIRGVLESLSNQEVLILADVFGATPCNVALKVADGVRVRVVTGVNVPMLWRSLCYADEALEALVARAVAGASQGVMQVAVPRRQNQAISSGTNDKDQHHHQQ